MGKRILKEQLIIAIILLLCGCSPIHFTENSHSQSVNTSSDRVVVSASDASTDNTLLEEETFSVKAQSAVEDFLSENQTPYRLGLFDLNEDGTPEVMVQNYIGQASKCIFYDLTDSEPAENYIRLNWPTISVVNVYTQCSEDSVKWRIEGNDSHGFTDRTRNEILEIENGEMKTIDCELTYTLGDDKEPYSLSVRTVINNEEIESLNFSLEGISVDKIDELLDGSLYQSYIQQDWEELDSPPWVSEATTTIGTDQLKTRISQLYSEWCITRIR